MDKFKIKLDKFDRKILAELDKNCRIPLTQLSKKVRKSRQAVEYRIEQLVKKQIILGFNTAINPHKLGYKIYKTYFQLRNIHEETEELIKFLNNCGKVYWYGECDGEWNLIFGIFAKSDYEFYNIKNQILSRFKKLILKHKGTLLLDSKQYPKMYFTDQISDSVIFGGDVKAYSLKSLDKRILIELVNNARIPVTKLAEKVKSTPTIIRNRMKNLEKAGIIIQYRISVNLEKLGLEFFKSIINIEGQNTNDEKRLIAFIGQLPNIQYFIRSLWNIEIELVVKDYSEYNKIINDLKEKFPNLISNVETVIMKSDVWIPCFIM